MRRFLMLCLAKLLLLSFALFGLDGSAQSAAPETDNHSGAGTPGFLARFSNPHRLTNSAVFQLSNGNLGIGTTEPIAPLHVFSSDQVGTPGYGPIAIWAQTSADNAAGAVYGVSSSPVGGIVVNGEAYGAGGIGVIGQGAQSGVIGQTSATNTFTVGVFGSSLATSGYGGVWVFGQACSQLATAGLFANAAGGNILEGGYGQPEITVFRVNGTGRVYADGGFQPSGADFAESRR